MSAVLVSRALERASLPRELRPFVDDAGRLVSWPARFKVQRKAAALLALRFEAGREYGEKDVNALLMDGHTFGDWALLRRTLVDLGFMARESSGARYWVHADAARLIAEQLPASDLPNA